MQAEREQRESEEAAEASKTEILEQAQSLAQEHWYEQAISLLQNAENLQALYLDFSRRIRPENWAALLADPV